MFPPGLLVYFSIRGLTPRAGRVRHTRMPGPERRIEINVRGLGTWSQECSVLAISMGLRVRVSAKRSSSEKSWSMEAHGMGATWVEKCETWVERKTVEPARRGGEWIDECGKWVLIKTILGADWVKWWNEVLVFCVLVFQQTSDGDGRWICEWEILIDKNDWNLNMKLD